jgi:hypothetical protein
VDGGEGVEVGDYCLGQCAGFEGWGGDSEGDDEGALVEG